MAVGSPAKEYVYGGGKLIATEEAVGGTQGMNQGFHDGAGCNTISGWAWDQSSPGTAVSVDIYDGVTLVGTALANMYREDLLNVLGSPNHGFSYATPAALKNGAAHTITVKYGGTSTVVGGSPKTIQCSQVASYQGVHDGAGCDTLSGWAWDSNDRSSIVNVDVYNGTTLIGTVAATQYRQDLGDVLGSPYHGFTYPMPASLRDGLSHAITVKFGGTGTNLTNSPKTMTCNSAGPSYTGNLQVANCTTITGYAWDTGDYQSTINVAIYADNVFQVVIPAQQVSAGIGNGYHGFIFAAPASLKNGQAHTIKAKISGTNIELTNSPRTITCPP